MSIQINTGNAGYHNLQQNMETAHKHHVTDCIHEDSLTKQKAGGGPGGLSSAGNGTGRRVEDIYQNMDASSLQGASSSQRQGLKGILQKGVSVLKSFWEGGSDHVSNASGRQLAEQATQTEREVQAERAAQAGIPGAASHFKTGFPGKIIQNAQRVRLKIQAGVKTAFQFTGHFKQDMFRHSKTGVDTSLDTAEARLLKQKKEKYVAEDPTRALKQLKGQDSYLLDSYGKDGHYCQITQHIRGAGGTKQAAKETNQKPNRL